MVFGTIWIVNERLYMNLVISIIVVVLYFAFLAGLLWGFIHYHKKQYEQMEEFREEVKEAVQGIQFKIIDVKEEISHRHHK